MTSIVEAILFIANPIKKEVSRDNIRHKIGNLSGIKMINLKEDGIMNINIVSVTDQKYLPSLMMVEQLAWASPGENISAAEPKIFSRISSKQSIQLALHGKEPVGSQFAFRFNWDGDIGRLGSWDAMTSCGWTDKVHIPLGNTGFLVGVGVVPQFRGMLFQHDCRWSGCLKASELLIAATLDSLFLHVIPVRTVIANARVPFYHKRPKLSIEEYCCFRREDGKLFDPVLRFHERMGARIIKPCIFSMEDAESLNAGCWVQYSKLFEL